MKTEIRLGSVVPHGVGGPEAAAMDLTYICLLHEFGQDIYRRIGINQIGEDLNEFVMKEPGNKIHVNIRYPAYKDFESKSAEEKNKIRLDVIHAALLRVAEYDKKLNIYQLEAIRKKILDNNFSFEFVFKSHVNKKNENLVAKITVHPEMDRFNYYAIIEENEKIKCRVHLYNGRTGVFFGEEFFFYGKWKGENEFIIWGKKKEVEIRILVDECRIDLVNLTRYANPPYFTVMRADISAEEREKAYQDWQHSLPPAVAGIIRQANN
jgi:hypothetical protein